MSASNDLENKILRHIFGEAVYSALATVYIALYTSDPGEAGSANTNECTGTGYARVAVTNNGTSWTVTGNAVTNDNIIDFGTAGAGGWGTVTHFAIVSSASGAGDILFSGALTTPKTINAGDPVTFPAGSLSTTAD